MASLLAKFRIDYSDLKVIPDITKKPRESTVSFFESLISEFKETEGTTDGDSPGHASKTCWVYFETCVWFLAEEGLVLDPKL
jgi:solute carrier family 12 sodium/potassium/chloride transporter 2